MDKNQGYSILKAVMLENGRGFALGECSREPSPFVTWACYDDEHGRRQYEWGHYGSDRDALARDLSERVEDYQRQFSVKVAWVEEPGLYKYYSTQRPVDIGTFPKPPHNAPDEIINYGGLYQNELQALQKDYADLWGPLSELLEKLAQVVAL